MSHEPLNTDSLIDLAREGDTTAVEHLLELHRKRLRRMVQMRLDSRLSARVDASDVVQETLADAVRRMPDYLQSLPMPFYPWLRRLAGERIAQEHNRHLHTKKRDVSREASRANFLPDESVTELIAMIVQSGTSPSYQLQRNELSNVVREALGKLQPKDQEVLIMRYLEQMSNVEIAAALNISDAAANMRHVRALERIHAHIGQVAREYFP